MFLFWNNKKKKNKKCNDFNFSPPPPDHASQEIKDLYWNYVGEKLGNHPKKNPNKSIYKTFTLRGLCELLKIDNVYSVELFLEEIDKYIKRNTYLQRPVEFIQVYHKDVQFYYIFKFNLRDIDIDRLEIYCIPEYKYLYEQPSK